LVKLTPIGTCSHLILAAVTLWPVSAPRAAAQQSAASTPSQPTATQPSGTQQPPRIQQKPPPVIDLALRGNLHYMLRFAHDDLQKYYYDTHYHGVDIDALYKQIDPKIDHAVTLSQGFGLVESYLLSLDDSHTAFIPPQRTLRDSSGFDISMVGDKCLVTRVRPKTDAAAKLHPGDQVLAYNNLAVERQTFGMMQRYYALNTMPGVILMLRSPDGKVRTEQVKYRLIKGKSLFDYTSDLHEEYCQQLRRDEIDEEFSRGRLIEAGDLAVWQMPTFEISDTAAANDFRRFAGQRKALVLDLRGNPGGNIDTLKTMVGYLFDHDVTIATLKARKVEKPMIAKSVHGHFQGKVFILVDSESGSAAELLARVVQLEHRGIVIGDKTNGSVMEAKYYPEAIGADVEVGYGFEITYADLIMADGKSLEKVGVQPDVLMLPTANDLASGADPVLAYAMTEAGVKMDPETAGKLFPYHWAPLNYE
jgi:C-terminal processing protease CtpA/Prc